MGGRKIDETIGEVKINSHFLENPTKRRLFVSFERMSFDGVSAAADAGAADHRGEEVVGHRRGRNISNGRRMVVLCLLSDRLLVIVDVIQVGHPRRLWT